MPMNQGSRHTAPIAQVDRRISSALGAIFATHTTLYPLGPAVTGLSAGESTDVLEDPVHELPARLLRNRSLEGSSLQPDRFTDMNGHLDRLREAAMPRQALESSPD